MGKLIEGLAISGVHSAGKAIGRHNGKNIFVSFGVPGDVVDVSLDRRQRGFYSGTIQQVKEPSDKRIAPFCKHHGICGGCNWQHIDYEEQLVLKRQILVNALQKYTIDTPPVPFVIPSDKKVFFRNKVEYAFASTCFPVGSARNQSPCLGFHPIEARDQVIDIEECWLQGQPGRIICEKARNIAVQQGVSFYNYAERSGLLRNLVIRTTTKGETLVVIGITTDEPAIVLPFLRQLKDEVPEISSLLYTVLSSPEKGYMDGDVKLFEGVGYLTETMKDFTFKVSPKAFFQPNPEQAQRIYEQVLDCANPSGNELVYDLYTGAGTIASFIAPQVRTVIGIEGSAEAIEDAGWNARRNKLDNARFIQGDILKTFTPDFVAENGKPDMVILDPPRSGTLIEIKKTIVGSAPQKIIYVSCNPVSLAYDLTMLTKGYRVTRIQPFDMFPHTHHVETLVLLEKE